MKVLKKLFFALLAMFFLFASCSNSSDTPQAPTNPTNTETQDPANPTNPETSETLDPNIELTRFVIPKVDIAYAGQTVMVTLHGKWFPYYNERFWTEDMPGATEYKNEIKKKAENFLSNISITCQKDPSIVADSIFSYVDHNIWSMDFRSDDLIVAYIKIPSSAGEYDIEARYGEKSIVRTLSVKDYSAYHTGDLLLKDGTIIPYDDSNVFSDEMKEKTIGVLYGFNDYGAPLGWLGIHMHDGLQWIKENDRYISMKDKFKTIICDRDDYWQNFDEITFNFDGIDGSDNWDCICAFDPVGTADAATNYPAFNYVNNYAATYGLTGDYASGWYMPSVAELHYLFQNRKIVDAVLDAVNVTKFVRENGAYWSSSTSWTGGVNELRTYDPWYGSFGGNDDPTKTLCVCCVRAFNENEFNDVTEYEKTVKQITLSKTNLTLTVGDTATLTATVLADDSVDKTVTWKSSASDVATVSDGVVTAVSKGTAIITAKAGNKSASCAVTVNPVTYQISVTNGTATPLLAEEGATVTIKANNPPSGKSFDKWTTTTEGITFANATAATTTFKMPAKAVSVTANYCEYYTVTYVDDNNITVPSDNKKYKAGETVTVLFSGIGYRKGFTFSGWCDNKGNSYTSAGTKTFAMPASNVTLTAEWNRINASGKIGMYETPCDVGDVVFKDGSATPYQSVTESQKESAIAVIFYVGTANNLLGKKTLGVGIYNTRDEVDEYYSMPKSTLQWAAYNSDANFKCISGIICEPSHTGKGAAAIATFTGDLDGSDNWNQLRKEVTDTNIYSSDGTPINTYPAWKWVNDYANNSASHVSGSNYKTGWYMPSIAELCMLWRNRRTVNNAISSIGGSTLREGYWSSSSNSENYAHNYAYILDFYDASDDMDGWIGPMSKDEKSTDAVCAIHAF